MGFWNIIWNCQLLEGWLSYTNSKLYVIPKILCRAQISSNVRCTVVLVKILKLLKSCVTEDWVAQRSINILRALSYYLSVSVQYQVSTVPYQTWFHGQTFYGPNLNWAWLFTLVTGLKFLKRKRKKIVKFYANFSTIQILLLSVELCLLNERRSNWACSSSTFTSSTLNAISAIQN